jgi:ABC-type uncharacterized transport system ATPase subunit
MAYQHFTLVSSMTAAENLVLGLPDLPARVRWDAARTRIEAFQAHVPFRIDVDRPVATLAAGEKQKLARAGEIVGVAGVSGNGQRELVEVLAGQRAPEGGVVKVGGARYRHTRAEQRRPRIFMLTEEPLRNACVARMSVAENLAFRTFDAPAQTRVLWLVSRRAQRERARELAGRIVVMFEGRLVHESARRDADVHVIGRHMTGRG